MLRILIILLTIGGSLVHAMEEASNYNTYKGIPITPKTLLRLAPKMPIGLKQRVTKCMSKYGDFISQLVTTPHPLTHESRKQKTIDNNALIKQYEEENKVKNYGGMNYVLRFTEYPEFSVPINRWGSRIAYWVYASGQGSVLDPHFNQNFDCSLFEYMPSYQHCSRAAHYIRLKEIAEKKHFKYVSPVPTYLAHIPGKPTYLSDENYVAIQTWINNLTEIRHLPEEERRAVKKNISFDAMKELYQATVYAALWNIEANLSVDGATSYLYLTGKVIPHLYVTELEEPFNHKPQFFYFQGEEGKEKYVQDVVASLERMARFFLENSEQFDNWRRLTEEDTDFQLLCDQYGVGVNYDPEYLLKRD